MIIPLSILFFLYLLVVLFFFILFFVQIYHVYHFSFWNRTGFIATGLYIAVFLTIIGLSFFLLSQVDWTGNINLFP
jgi:hypothetical protein